ncbi:BRO-N domain-containing protein [Enterobacter oligotrophicus]|uniref:BRO-N domain-containing protein n=1 Tax=Enterobacter oligotrophicus TaxID=2478464 RepID=UPI0023F4869B|nr:BRO family protein [Enterobacter oligotrophicus]
MSALAVFEFQEAHKIRVVLIDGNPWFVAADVCKALALSNPTKAIKSLDDDEVALTSIQGLSRGNDLANVVNESGLYTLILRCRDAVKPGTLAHGFRKWVTNEVLPAIRQNGFYGYYEAAPKAAAEPLTPRDRAELQALVNDIATNFHYRRTWVSGVWYALRRATGNPSPNPFTTDELPAIIRELRRILAATEVALTEMRGYEREFLKTVIRDAKPATGSAVLPAVMPEYESDAALPARFEVALERLERLAEKLSGTGYGVA